METWGLLPDLARVTLEKAGYRETQFKAVIHPEHTKLALWRFIPKPIGDDFPLLTVSDMQKIEDAGVRVYVGNGILSLHLNERSY